MIILSPLTTLQVPLPPCHSIPVLFSFTQIFSPTFSCYKLTLSTQSRHLFDLWKNGLSLGFGSPLFYFFLLLLTAISSLLLLFIYSFTERRCLYLSRCLSKYVACLLVSVFWTRVGLLFFGLGVIVARTSRVIDSWSDVVVVSVSWHVGWRRSDLVWWIKSSSVHQ